MKKILLCIIIITTIEQLTAQTKHKISPADIYRLQTISDPHISPDGKWVSYTLSTVDSAKDKRNSDVWMVSWGGEQTLQLTNTPEGESSARWSPDGKYISFISSRMGEKNSQLWLMDRRGGEAKKITDIKGDLEEYVWSPDGKKIAMVIKDQDFSDTAKSKTRNPFVMDRYHFKEDIEGYIENRYSHLYVFDITSKKTDTLTKGNYDESSPVWSPDGKQLAFVSNRSADPDRNDNTDIWIMDAKPGASLKQITTWPGADRDPQWSPDGKLIAYLQSSSNEAFTMYGQNKLAIVSVNGGTSPLFIKPIDRPVRDIHWSKNGQMISLLLTDDRKQYIGQINMKDSSFKTISTGEVFLNIESIPSSEALVACISSSQLPVELYAVENDAVRRLTHVQDSFINPIQLSTVEGFKSTSKDGTKISGILYRPADAPANQKLPLILFIHGGPVGQDEFSFDLSRQILSAAGYAVAAVNYRGSNGRGLDFTRAIIGDWGNKEVMDIMGAADYLVEKGIADADKIGIGGWSYGGILTNYCIATDTRFKAAASGAGSSLQFTMYGVDQYVTQYENELGTPWKNPEKWMKLSYPFFKVDKIKTPTLFMAGEKDFNVPSVGAEQMYQALRSIGIPTQLVIYPGQFHGITKPSYQKDRLDRYIQWFGKYLK